MATFTESISNAGKIVRQTIGSALSGIHAGDEKLTSKKTPVSAPGKLQVKTDAFADGQPIPERYTPQGQNTSPALFFAGVPAEAREIVLIVEDPDAPFPNPFVHWILHGLSPDVRSLPAALPNEAELSDFDDAVQGQNDNKTRGWFGPKPPMGHGVHHYHFQVFALDIRLDLDANATLSDLKEAMTGHVLADGELVGTFERSASTK